MGKYKTKITEYGYRLINEVLSGAGILVTDGWHVALGNGELEPALKTTKLSHIIFDKNSTDYSGIIIGQNKNSRYAEIVLPESLHGCVITEIGLFDNKDNLVVCANTKIDCTERTEEGFDIDYRARIDLGAIDSDVAIQFQGGTFQLLEEKGTAGGYAPLDGEAKVPFEHLPSTFIPFCFNSGAVNENGEPALLQLSTVTETMPSENTAQAGAVASDEDDTSTTQATWSDSSPGAEGGEEIFVTRQIVTLKAPAVYTDGNGKTLTITEDLTLDVTDFEPGAEYSLRVAENINSGAVEFFAVEGGKVYRQKAEPENPKDGDLWQNLSVAPSLAYIYSALQTENIDENSETAPAGTWQITNQVEAGAYIVPSENSGGGGGGGGGN